MPVLLYASVSSPSTSAPGPDSGQTAADAKAKQAYAKLPLTFVENQGQLDKRVRYVINGPRGSAFFTDDGLTLDLWDAPPVHDTKNSSTASPVKPSQPQLRKRAVLKVFFDGANHECTAAGLDKLPGSVNYMVGKDQSKWHTGIPTFRRVIYKNVWSGIDLVYQGDGGQLKYNVRVSPGADLKSVRLRYEGADKIWLDGAGDLHVQTSLGAFVEKSPTVYQLKGDKEQPLHGGFALLSERMAGFKAEGRDSSLPLVIDPRIDAVDCEACKLRR
jgi:hypothetical protein